MQVHEFRCPQCATRLRCRDRSWVGRQVRCPDCRTSVVVVVGPDGELCAERLHPSRDMESEPPSGPGDPATAGSETAGRRQGRSVDELAPLRAPRSWRERLLSPSGVGWGVAVTTAVVFVSWLIGSGTGDQSQQNVPVTAVAVSGGGDEDVVVEREESTESTEDRLLTLFGWMQSYHDEHGNYPSGTGTSEGLGWQAVVVAAQPDQAGSRVHWDRDWNDPQNDEFVRRRIDTLLNPGLELRTGSQGYPATHFAGIAGVGEDAADLPTDHPRAGIFGSRRSTSFEDVTDGLANTMLVAGVTEDLSSWAASGRGTVRAFSQEPYVNGPDGFGTGDNEGMHVLMADGSVRFISTDTDPTIIRRMAAMADGLPLDIAVPGEPGDSAAVDPLVVDDHPPLPVDPFAGHGGADLAIDVLLAEDEPLIDVQGALEFPVAEFVQTTPVSLLEMLYQWEELAGIPIDATPLDSEPTAVERLQQDVTLTLADTTLGEILRELLAQADMRYDATPGGVRLGFGDPSR